MTLIEVNRELNRLTASQRRARCKSGRARLRLAVKLQKTINRIPVGADLFEGVRES